MIQLFDTRFSTNIQTQRHQEIIQLRSSHLKNTIDLLPEAKERIYLQFYTLSKKLYYKLSAERIAKSHFSSFLLQHCFFFYLKHYLNHKLV